MRDGLRSSNPKRGRQPENNPVADLPSPPQSTPRTDRPAKKRKTGHREAQDHSQALCWVSEVRDETDPLRPPRFWDSLSRIPLVPGALGELDRRNRHVAAASAQDISVPSNCGLRRYARLGGPDLSKLRGFEQEQGEEEDQEWEEEQEEGEHHQEEEFPRNRRSRGGINKQQHDTRGQPSSAGKKTRSSSPYDAAFKQHLIDYRIWPMNHWYEDGDEPLPPDNLEDIITHVHNNLCASFDPQVFTIADFKSFKKSYHLTAVEEPRSRTLELVEGVLSVDIMGVKRGPVKLSRLYPITPDQLVPGYPDRAYGARPRQLDRVVRDDPQLHDLILPTPAQDILCPNFIVHVKGPGGSSEVADVQAVYDGALAARGMEALWAFGTEGDEDQPYVARTITCTFVGGVLRMYAVYIRPCGGSATNHVERQQSASRDAEDGVEYITTRIGSWFLDESLEDLRRAARAFRNGLEWAQKQRDEAIDRANRKVDRGQGRHVQSGSRLDVSDPSPERSSSTDPIA